MMLRWPLIILIISVLEFHQCMSSWSTCDQAYKQAESHYYSNKARYTCIDLQYIQHGKGCYRKCDAISSYYSLFGHRYCKEGTCPAPVSYKYYSTSSLNQCNREHTAGECDPYYAYRSISGHCNNLMYPDWGKSETFQTRLLPNAYDDGHGTPRTRGIYGGTLPNAREISNIVHVAGSNMEFEPTLTYMVMQIGQFLAHDMVLSKLETKENGSSLMCCEEDKDKDVCNPIQIPMDDPHFTPGSCMDFARTKTKKDCNGVLQQLNSQTSYLDLSMLYGADDEEANELRTHENGLLLSIHNKLPVDWDDKTCDLSRPIDVPNYYCGHSGDPRVNENPGLAAIHTIFLREHNRLAKDLAVINPHWNDERLFQEARKINIAQWQNIVYTEYLPVLVGPKLRRKHGLNIHRRGYTDTYSQNVDASITNSFAVAVFRFGHSMVHQHISMMDYSHHDMMSPPEHLEDNFFETNLYHANNSHGLEHLLMWTSYTKCPFRDAKLERSVQTLLFQDEQQLSFDLAALNIHRGRDHGVPSYNTFRELCHLPKVLHFGGYPGGLVDHDPDVAHLLQQAYAHSSSDDIDLFTGLVSERRVKGSILGPTGECLMAIQFKRLKDGDRFFFERHDQWNPAIGFTEAQLNSIKQVRLSTLFCLNMGATEIQTNLFMQTPEQSWWCGHNHMRSCAEIKHEQVNIHLWRSYT